MSAATSGVEQAARPPGMPATGDIEAQASGGGVQAAADGKIASVNPDVAGEASARVDAGQAGAQATVERGKSAAVDESGLRQPADEVAGVEARGRGYQAGAEARVQGVENVHGEASRVVDDPTAAGSARAQAEVDAKVASATPAGVTQARADAATAQRIGEDPRGAAVGAAEARVEAERNQAEASVGANVGVSGSVSGSGAVDADVTGGPQKK